MRLLSACGARPHKAVLCAHILTSVGWFGVAVLVGRVARDALVTDRAPVPLYGSTIAHVVVLVVATVLSVCKPRGRTPWPC